MRYRDALVKDVLIIAGLFMLNAAGPPGNLAFFGALMLLSCRSGEWTIKALIVMYIALVGNTALVNTGNSIFSMGKFLFLLFACLRLWYSLALQGKSVLSIPIVTPLLAFVTVALLLAIEGGYYLHVSVLKLFAFLVGTLTVFFAVEVMKDRAHSLDRWFFAVAAFVVIVSLASLGLGIGYNAKSTDYWVSPWFNGAFYHPQTMGPGAAMFAIFLLAYALLSKNPLKVTALGMIGCFLLFVYLSSSRTSLLAVALGVILPVFVMAFMRRDAMNNMVKILYYSLLLLVLAAVGTFIVEVIDPGRLMTGILEFILKSEDTSQVSAEAVLSSRDVLVQRMLGNIAENPWTGIGFGTSTDIRFIRNVGLFSAPAEKGVMPIAVLEEVGIIGVPFFVAFFLSIIVYALREDNLPGLMAFSALFGLNMAEANFFSFGGQGGFFWMIVMASFILGQSTKRSRVVPNAKTA